MYNIPWGILRASELHVGAHPPLLKVIATLFYYGRLRPGNLIFILIGEDDFPMKLV
jgi:hypothetical protein